MMSMALITLANKLLSRGNKISIAKLYKSLYHNL